MRALISVYDKSGIVEFAQGLDDLGWDLVSSGGTAAALRDAGLTVTDTGEFTGFPAILGHRVMTLHPKVHGGLLADRTDPSHQADMADHGIEPFDLLVSNLYPFGSDPADFEHGATAAEELIDIGGPAMIRAAAKNHVQLGVVVDPADYYLVEIRRAHGANLVGTIRRAFGGQLAPGRTVLIQLVEEGLADAGCALEFAAGESWLLHASVAGSALRVSRFNSHNVPSGHERFAGYLDDIEKAAAGR